jgi:hypothetical protein
MLLGNHVPFGLAANSFTPDHRRGVAAVELAVVLVFQVSLVFCNL